MFCFADSLWGMKHFQDFKKTAWKLGFWKCQNRFSKTIKWKDCQMTPLGSTFAESLKVIKHFQHFKKATWKLGFWKCQNCFSNTIKWKDCEMDTTGSCFRRVPLGDKSSHGGVLDIRTFWNESGQNFKPRRKIYRTFVSVFEYHGMF